RSTHAATRDGGDAAPASPGSQRPGGAASHSPAPDASPPSTGPRPRGPHSSASPAATTPGRRPYGAPRAPAAPAAPASGAPGEPADLRTGAPLLVENAAGNRGWEMRWDPEGQQWVAQNRGNGLDAVGLPVHGEPSSFGYDANGHRLPYANHRPEYALDQVHEV